jgi:autophagy-related protein 5
MAPRENYLYILID